MSTAQITVATPADGTPEAYIAQIYPIDACAKLIQIPATGRIAKITGAPAVGQVISYAAVNAGTVASPDALGFVNLPAVPVVPTTVTTLATARDVTTPFGINMTVGSKIPYNALAYDNSGGQFGISSTEYTLPNLYPAIYNIDASVIVNVAATASLFYITMNIILDDGITQKIIGAQTIFVNGVMLSPYVFSMAASAQCSPAIANTKVYVTVIGSYSTGVIPSTSATGGRFAISQSGVLS